MKKFKQIDYSKLAKNSYMISIDDERYDLTCKVFKQVLGFIPNKFKGFSYSKYINVNVKLTHLDIIKLAKAKNLPYVFIFEDDAYPCIDCKEKLQEYIKNVPLDAKMVLLGFIGIDKQSSPQPLIHKFNKNISNIYGAHADIVFNDYYDSIIDLICKYMNSRPIDDIINNFAIAKENTYVIDNSLFIQYNYNNKTINNHIGYCYFDINSKYGYANSKTPPVGFLPIEDPRMLGKKK